CAKIIVTVTHGLSLLLKEQPAPTESVRVRPSRPRGSDAPKLTRRLESWRTACPLPIVAEYSLRTLNLWPFCRSCFKTSGATRDSTRMSQPMARARIRDGESGSVQRGLNVHPIVDEIGGQ